jgi:hypothetical protein
MSVSTFVVKAMHEVISKNLKSIVFLNGLYGIEIYHCGSNEIVFKLRMFPEMIAFNETISTFFTLETRTEICNSVMEYLNLLKEQIVMRYQRIVLRLANGFHACAKRQLSGWLNIRLMNSREECVAMIYGKSVPVFIDFTCEEDDMKNVEKHFIQITIPQTVDFTVEKLNEVAKRVLEEDEGYRMDTELKQKNKWGYEQYALNLLADGPENIPISDILHLNAFEDSKTRTHIISLLGHGVRF